MSIKNNDLQKLTEMYNKVSNERQLNEAGPGVMNTAIGSGLAGGASAALGGAPFAATVLPAAAIGAGLYGGSKLADVTAKGIGNVVGNIGARLTAGSQGLTGSQAVKLRQINKEFDNLLEQLSIIADEGIDVSYIQGKLEEYKANSIQAIAPRSEEPEQQNTRQQAVADFEKRF